MKNILRSTLLLLFGVTLLTACVDDFDYTPAAAYKGLYITADNTNITFQPTDESKTINVKVVRTNANEAQTITFSEVTMSDETAFSGVPESVTFEAGQTEAEFTVTCDIEPGEDATLAITLPAGTYDQTYFSGTLTIKANVEFVWEDAGIVHFKSSVFGFEDDIKVMHPAGTNRYVLKDVIVEGYDLEFTLDDDYNALEWPNMQNTGYEYGDYGFIYYYHPATYPFYNDGNVFYLAQTPVVYLNGGLAAVDDAGYEIFEWTEGYPGE